jgi:hypothetical protein
MLDINEQEVRLFLANYGVSLEDVLEQAKKHKVPVAEQDWIYLTHHMHPPKKASEMETLHHCVMWEKKNEKGMSWEQMHVKDGQIFQHALNTKDIKEVPSIVYDHLNNQFKTKDVEINKKEYVILNGLKSVKKTKWSDQDVGGYYDSIS